MVCTVVLKNIVDPEKDVVLRIDGLVFEPLRDSMRIAVITGVIQNSFHCIVEVVGCDTLDVQLDSHLGVIGQFTRLVVLVCEQGHCHHRDTKEGCLVGATQTAVQAYSERIDQEMDKLSVLENQESSGVLDTLRSLVAMNENLKKQEQEFRAHCKEEMARLQDDIAKLKSESGDEMTEDQERAALIDRQYQSDKEKLHKIRLLLARKNREISALQRKIDEVPSRAELSQYQRRFVELYSQIAATHKETKQFYTLYNTLDDTKLYLNKEVNLLNSIHDNFEQAMSNAAGREQFLKQFEQIVDGIKQNRAKLEKKKQQEKSRRDQLNDEHLDMVEKQRVYFKTVKEFKEECRRNEILLSKVKG